MALDIHAFELAQDAYTGDRMKNEQLNDTTLGLHILGLIHDAYGSFFDAL